jgi:hypothetical protein
VVEANTMDLVWVLVLVLHYCLIYTLNTLPTKKETKAANPPIIKVFNPDLTVDLSTTFLLIDPIAKNDMAVDIIEQTKMLSASGYWGKFPATSFLII